MTLSAAVAALIAGTNRAEARPRGGKGTPGRDPQFGFGRVNLSKVTP